MPSGPMEAYERETRTVIKRFLSRKLSFTGCIAALDALIPKLSGEQMAHLRAVMLANNETVMKEMERRKSLHEAP